MNLILELILPLVHRAKLSTKLTHGSCTRQGFFPALRTSSTAQVECVWRHADSKQVASPLLSLSFAYCGHPQTSQRFLCTGHDFRRLGGCSTDSAISAGSGGGCCSAAAASVVADATFTTKANERNSAMGGAMGVQCVCRSMSTTLPGGTPAVRVVWSRLPGRWRAGGLSRQSRPSRGSGAHSSGAGVRRGRGVAKAVLRGVAAVAIADEPLSSSAGPVAAVAVTGR